MKIITVLLSAAFLLCNCGGSNYTVSGHYGLAPGDSVFLFASNKSIIGSGVMATDTTFRLKGKVAGTDIATLSAHAYLSGSGRHPAGTPRRGRV